MLADSCLPHSDDELELVQVLDRAFRERMMEVMDQSQHTSADGGGEGAAYEFCQGLDTWEKQRESFPSPLAVLLLT